MDLCQPITSSEVRGLMNPGQPITSSETRGLMDLGQPITSSEATGLMNPCQPTTRALREVEWIFVNLLTRVKREVLLTLILWLRF